MAEIMSSTPSRLARLECDSHYIARSGAEPGVAEGNGHHLGKGSLAR